MIDLNAIYDREQGDGTKPKATPAKPADLGSLGETPSPVKFGETSDVNVQDYNKYLENGVYSDRPIDLIRGQNQSVAEKIGLRLANFVPNIVAGTAEMIGYTGALASEWGDDRDYSNAFTQAGAAMRDPFGKTYARSNDVFAFSDPTWWIDNVANIAEVGVSFSGEVGLVGKWMGELANGAAKVFNAGQKTARAIGGAAQLATAGFSAYTEAAMDGAQVYDQTYKTQLQKQLDKGLDPEEAKKQATHLAAQSAATTVQLSTAMTTLLNLSSVAPFFKKSEDVVQDVLRNEIGQKIGETAEQWANRIKSLKADDFSHKLFDHHGMGEFLKEMGQEGVEEVEQQFAQQTGQDEGKDGKVHGLVEQLGQFEHFFDRTLNAQGALAFVLGAAGGGLQTALIHHVVPSKRSTIDENGNDMPQAVNADGTLKFDTSGNPVFSTKLVTPRTYDEWSTKKTFNTARDMVAEDVANFSKMQSAYFDAVKKGDNVAMDKARTEMFNVANINAVTTGMTEAWKNTYQNIADYDNSNSIDPADENGPTEAMARGYAKDRNDSEYQAKANSAVRDLDSYQEEYEKLRKRYGADYESNAGIKSVVDMMFNRKVNLMANEKLIKHHEEEVKKLEQEQSELAKMSDPSNFDEIEMNYDRSITTAQEVSRRLVADHKALVDAINKKDTKKVKELAAKYRAVGTDENDLQGAVNDLANKISRVNEVQQKKVQQAEENLFNGSGFQTWLSTNPTGTYQQYRELVHRKYALDGPTQAYRANVDAAKSEHEIHASNYAEAVNERNVDRFVAKANKWQEAMVAEAQAVAAQKQMEISRIAKDKATATRMQKLQLNEIAERYREALGTAQQQLSSKTEELNKVKEQLKNTSMVRDPLKYAGLKSQIKQLNKDIALLNAQIKHYASLYNDHAVDTSTPDQDVGVGSITDEDNDLPEEGIEGPETPDLSTGLVVEEPDTVVPGPPVTDNVEDFQSADEDTLNFGETQTALQTFQAEMVGKPQQVIDHFNGIAEQFRSELAATGKINLDGRRDKLVKAIVPTYIKKPNAIGLLEALKDAIEEEGTDTMVPSQGEEGTKSEPEPVTGSPVDIAPIPEPLDPVTDNSDEGIALQEEGLRHAGKKIDNPISIANSTINFVEGFDSANKAFFKATDSAGLNKDLNIDILTPGKLNAGTAIRFEIDKDWDGAVNIDDRLAEDEYGQKAKRADKFSDYLKSDGTIDENKIGDLPIKIIDKATGKKIGNVRRMGWLMAKYPGTEDYLNFNDQVDEDGIHSIDKAQADLMRIRKFIVDSHNNNQPIEGKITAKGMGLPILNRDTNLNGNKKSVVKTDYAYKLIPDNSVQIGVVNAGKAYTSKGYEFDGTKGYDKVDLNDGATVLLLPGANGQHFYTPLVGQKLFEVTYNSKGEVQSQRKSAVQSVVRAIELYMLHDGTNADVQKEVDTIRNKTGFDITTASGLRNFISQYYTHLDSFDIASLQPGAPVAEGQKKTERFVFNITDPITSSKGLVHAGRTYSGVYTKANIVNGKLNPEFVKVLTDGFATRSRIVAYTRDGGIKGINSSGPFTEINYKAEKGWAAHTHDSYNDYVKSWSKTAVNGTNQLPNGKYVYVANPQMPFEVTNINQPVQVKIEENTSPDTPNLSTALEVEPAPAVDQDVMDLIFGEMGMENNKVTVHEIGTAPVKTKELSVQNLEDIYSRTEFRNGLTPLEVFTDLQERGHTFLPEGYNPFSECL